MRKRAEERAKVKDLEPGDIVLYNTVFPEHAGAGPEELTVAGVEVEAEMLETLVHFEELESPVAFDSHDVTIGLELRANPKEDPEEHRMSNLKQQLIRLGDAQPELREHLRPILDEVTSKVSARSKRADYEQTVQNFKRNVLETVVGEKIRVRWSRESVLLEEIKGGRHRRWLHTRFGYLAGIKHFDPFIAQNLMQWARISKSDSYERAASKIQESLEKAIEETLKAYDVEEDELRRNLYIMEDTVYFTKVAPGSDEPIVADGKDFSVESTWTDFQSYDPSADLQSHDPSYTLYKAKSSTQARKLYKILDNNPNALANVTWNDFGDWLDRNKIKYDTHFSVWR